MADDGLTVDAVLCSTAVRTRQTLHHTGIEAPATFVEDIYGGDALPPPPQQELYYGRGPFVPRRTTLPDLIDGPTGGQRR